MAALLAEGPGGDYGVHSEMFTTGLMRLHKAGKVTKEVAPKAEEGKEAEPVEFSAIITITLGTFLTIHILNHREKTWLAALIFVTVVVIEYKSCSKRCMTT